MCFSLAWLEQLLIWLVIVCAVIGILKLIVPFVLTQLGAGGWGDYGGHQHRHVGGDLYFRDLRVLCPHRMPDGRRRFVAASPVIL